MTDIKETASGAAGIGCGCLMIIAQLALSCMIMAGMVLVGIKLIKMVFG